MAPADWLTRPVALSEGLSVGVLDVLAVGVLGEGHRGGVVAAQREAVDVAGRFLDLRGVEGAVDHGQRRGRLLAGLKVLPVGALVDGVALGLVDGGAVGALLRQPVDGDPVAGDGGLVHGAVAGGLAVLVLRARRRSRCSRWRGCRGPGRSCRCRPAAWHEVLGSGPGQGERGLGDEREVVLVQRPGHGADVLGDVAGVVDFLDLDRVLEVKGGAGADDQRNRLRVGGQLAGALGLLVLASSAAPST